MSRTGQWDPRDQRDGSWNPKVIIVTIKTRTCWVYNLRNTQSWEGTEHEAEEADRHAVSEAGKSAAV